MDAFLEQFNKRARETAVRRLLRTNRVRLHVRKRVWMVEVKSDRVTTFDIKSNYVLDRFEMFTFSVADRGNVSITRMPV